MEDNNIKNFLSLDSMSVIKELVVEEIGAAVVSAIKHIKLDTESNTLFIYNVTEVTDETEPMLSIILPSSKIQDVIGALKTAEPGTILKVDENNDLVDSGLKVGDIATKEEVAEVAANHITKKKITQEELNALTESSEWGKQTIYLVPDESVTGEDIYKEYTDIDGELTCIGTTSVSLEGLASEEVTNELNRRVTDLEEKVGEGFREVTEEEIIALWKGEDNVTPEPGQPGTDNENGPSDPVE